MQFQLAIMAYTQFNNCVHILALPEMEEACILHLDEI